MSTGLPVDIARLKFPWRRRASDAWSDAAFRAPVLTFLDDFLVSRNWADAWEVVEKFTSTGINVRTRFGPTGIPNFEDFRQRDGDRILVVTVFRSIDRAPFEVGLTFTKGARTSADDIDRLLAQASQTFDALNRRVPLP